MRKSTKPTLSARVRLALLALPAAFASVALSSCNKHVFEVHEEVCITEENRAEPIDVDVPADILIVIDNSGSMCEEQQNLIDNFFDPSCPIDVDNVQDEYKNPGPELVQQLAANCGFVQLLAAYENDWRIGVITTDVGTCDDRFNVAEDPALTYLSCQGEPVPGWGRRPQRGCLQPWDINDRQNTRVLTRNHEGVGEKFESILKNVRTFGSAFERGLDAMQVFLSPNSRRAPGCEGDLDAFMRDNAKLVVIFVTDEDDCSHADGQFGLPDENADEASCDTVQDLGHGSFDTGACYTRLDELAPTSRYSSFLRAYKGDESKVSVAVIAGALADDNGNMVAGGCTIGGDGQPVGGCFESGGNSNRTGDDDLCDPSERTCCTADPGKRYFQFARELGAGRFLNDSICFDSFRNTMLDIAKFIAAKDFVTLGEKPASSSAIIVEITRAGETERSAVQRIPDGEDPTGKDGWQYDGNLTITLYGNAKAGPGDTIHVAALSNRDGELDCADDNAPAADAGSN